jgi:hypothetical protein
MLIAILNQSTLITDDQGGKLRGVVSAKPELDNHGQPTTGDWSVSSVLSHEVLEMYIDPNCNLWAKLGLLHAPFSLLKGGYVVFESAGKQQQTFGDEFPTGAGR